MAQRTELAWIGSLNDPAFGVDDEGEMFYTIADATAALHARHRGTNGESHPVIRPTGTYQHEHFGTLTDEAFILLWRVPEADRADESMLIVRHEEGIGLDARAIMAAKATHVVWIGARQAIRHGYAGEFEDQQARRKRQDVREAGSVVVTDA